jgi:hypothetical protein
MTIYTKLMCPQRGQQWKPYDIQDEDGPNQSSRAAPRDLF